MVNPQFSITADGTSQMPVQENPELQAMGRIQRQIVETIPQEGAQQRTDEQIVAVRVPTVQEQVIVQKNQSSRLWRGYKNKLWGPFHRRVFNSAQMNKLWPYVSPLCRSKGSYRKFQELRLSSESG